MYARPIIHGTGLLLLLESAGGILQHVVAVLRARRAGMRKQLAHRGLCAVWSFRAHCFKKKRPLLRVLMCARRESCERRIGIPVGVHTVKTPAWLQLAACPRRCAQATYARHWTSIAPGISWWYAAACLGRCAREAGIVLACRCEQTPAASLEPWLRRKRARMHE